MTSRLHPDDIVAIAQEVARLLQSDNRSVRIPAVREATHYNGSRGAKRHRELIQKLVKIGCSTGGFRDALEESIGHRFDDAPKIIPDAYLIKPDLHAVGMFEVTVTSGMGRCKLDKICRWRDWIVGHGWSFRLIEVYEHGKCFGIDPETGDLDDESNQRVADFFSGRIEL